MSYSGGQQSFRNGRILMFGFKLGEFLKTFIRMNNTCSGICFGMFPLLLSHHPMVAELCVAWVVVFCGDFIDDNCHNCDVVHKY